MNTSAPQPDLPAAVAHLARSVIGVGSRPHRSAALLWRPGVLVGSASALWRHAGVALTLPNGEQAEGQVRGLDGATDLAAITFDSGELPAAVPAAAPDSRVGDFVFAVGREPSGLVQASFGHVGMVGGEWRTWRGGRVEQLIRLDGGLYPGLAGAPVADGAGRVLGVASPALSRHHAVVLPVATVERVLAQLLAHGKVERGYLGVAAQPARTALEGQPVAGLLVSSVAEAGPAAMGGVMVGDVILEVGGVAVNSLDELRDRLQVGAEVAVAVVRGGQLHRLTLTVAQRPGGRCG